MSERLVIVGAGMATAYLLQELAAVDHDFEITVISAEDRPCYNRILLSGVLSGDYQEADLDMLDQGPGSTAPRFINKCWVTGIDAREKLVKTSVGGPVAYDTLVIATGATPRRPQLPAAGSDGVYCLRTLQDSRELLARASESGDASCRHAVVVGGGLLGLEAAHGLAATGYRVTVVHRNQHILNRQLDTVGGQLLQAQLQQQGIEFCLAAEIKSVQSPGGRVTALELADGRSLPCELLLFATGIEPNIALASGSGLRTDRGVLVDDFLRTSARDIFALGECCQVGQECFGLVAPIQAQARVLAGALMGRSVRGFVNEPWPTQLKVSGVEIFSAGELSSSGDELVLRDWTKGIYRRLVLRHDRLVGAVLVGDKRGGNWYSELIQSKQPVTAFRSGLMFGRQISEAMQSTAQAA